jgi:hypothetical protein
MAFFQAAVSPHMAPSEVAAVSPRMAPFGGGHVPATLLG